MSEFALFLFCVSLHHSIDWRPGWEFNSEAHVLGCVRFNRFRALSSFAINGVNEADKMAKRINGKLLKQEWDFHQSKSFSKCTSLHFADSERAFKLSEWGSFFYARSFIPVAFGSLLTYTLLLIQLDRSSLQMTMT
ncbi:hypothetical protein NPIL_668431 [Nephila pilipes]|uniref:Uncharacterized protein n=1 Tax=Nephila pilipes TaxID=299642 RepID=A0A8X6NWJ5_NEPPI|nr:hypothetical protein NPIL_668431 [Nephila pilipes]